MGVAELELDIEAVVVLVARRHGWITVEKVANGDGEARVAVVEA